MADNWSPVRQYNRGRGNQRGGGRGGRAGRPLNLVLEQRPPGSPIANTISVKQGVPSTDDNLLNIFLEVIALLLLIASYCIAVRGPSPRNTCWMRIHFQNKNNLSQAPRAKTKEKTRSQHSPEPTLPSGTDILPNHNNKHNRPSHK